MYKKSSFKSVGIAAVLACTILTSGVVSNVSVNASTITPTNVKNVYSFADLKNAFADKSTTQINLMNDITLTANLNYYGSNLTINGNNHLLTSGKFQTAYYTKGSNINFVDMKIKGASSGIFANVAANSLVEFKNIQYLGGHKMYYSISSTVKLNNVEFVGYKMIYDLTGTAYFDDKNWIYADYTIGCMKNFIISKDAYLYADTKLKGLYLATNGAFIAAPNSKVVIDSKLNAVYNASKTGYLQIENGANVSFASRNSFNNQSAGLDHISVDANAKLNITNDYKAEAHAIVQVINGITVANNGELNINNKTTTKTAKALYLSGSSTLVDVKEGGRFSVSNSGGQAIYSASNHKSGIQFKNADLQAWKPGIILDGNPSEKYTSLSGYLTFYASYTKSNYSNQSTFNSVFGGMGKTKLPYAKISINSKTEAVISVDKKDISYEKGTKKTETEFFKDINVQTTNPSVPLKSNFASKVDFNTVGTYDVTITQDGGNTVLVKVTIFDNTKTQITSDNLYIYDTAGKNLKKTQDEFLNDINAKTNDGSSLTSDFHESILNKVGYYEIELKAYNSKGEIVSSTMVTIVIHPGKTVVGKKSVLFADNFAIPLGIAPYLDKDLVKIDALGKVVAFDYENGTNLFDSVEVNATQLNAIKLSRKPGTHKLEFKVTNKGETITTTIDVVLE